MKPIKIPSIEDMDKVIELRKVAKRGGYLPRESMRYLMKMMKEYPEWYGSTETKVWNETLPYGSDAYKKEGNNNG